MVTFLLHLLHGVRIGLRFLTALETVDHPAVTQAAYRYRVAACCFLALTGVLAIPAAIVHTMVGECRAFDILGFGAIIAAGLTIFCLVRFADTNHN